MTAETPAVAPLRRRIVYKAMLAAPGQLVSPHRPAAQGQTLIVYLLPRICENLTAMNRDFHKQHFIRIGEKTYRILSMWVAKEEEPQQ